MIPGAPHASFYSGCVAKKDLLETVMNKRNHFDFDFTIICSACNIYLTNSRGLLLTTSVSHKSVLDKMYILPLVTFVPI